MATMYCMLSTKFTSACGQTENTLFVVQILIKNGEGESIENIRHESGNLDLDSLK